MKRTLWMLFDVMMIPAGLVLICFGFYKWYGLGFIIEDWSDVSTNEGRAAFSFILLGIGLILYGLFDYWAFRREKKG
jgi:hypothetical protein